MDLSLALRTVDGTTAHCAWELVVGATPGRVRLMELGVFVAAATASQFGVGFSGAVGVTPTSPVDYIKHDPSDVLATGVIQSAVAWGTAPTIPTAYLRRISLPGTVGTGVIWTFGDGIIMPVSSSLILWNIGTNAVADVYAVVRL
jgi:hypothetical protein